MRQRQHIFVYYYATTSAYVVTSAAFFCIIMRQRMFVLPMIASASELDFDRSIAQNFSSESSSVFHPLLNNPQTNNSLVSVVQC